MVMKNERNLAFLFFFQEPRWREFGGEWTSENIVDCWRSVHVETEWPNWVGLGTIHRQSGQWRWTDFMHRYTTSTRSVTSV